MKNHKDYNSNNIRDISDIKKNLKIYKIKNNLISIFLSLDIALAIIFLQNLNYIFKLNNIINLME